MLPQFPTPERVRCALWDVATEWFRFLSTSSSLFLECRVRAYDIINLISPMICWLATTSVDPSNRDRDFICVHITSLGIIRECRAELEGAR